MAKKSQSAAPARTPAAAPPSRIVAATGVSVGTGNNRKTNLGKAMEAAQQQAILDAAKEGIGSDQTEELKRRMAAAREKVMDEFQAAEAKIAAEAKTAAENK